MLILTKEASKGQIKPKAERFSQETNDRFPLFYSKNNNKFIPSFFGRIYGAQICLQFYLTFSGLIQDC